MIDQEKIQQGVKLILEGIGEDLNRDGLKATPQRVAKAYQEIFAGYDQTSSVHLSTTFETTDSQLVVVRDIKFYSMCEHHMLPFFGTVDIIYLPGTKVVGLSKLARLVEVFARRLQIQEQMTYQIADSILSELKTDGVYVRVRGSHMCMSMRGVNNDAQTVTVYNKGIDAHEAALLLGV